MAIKGQCTFPGLRTLVSEDRFTDQWTLLHCLPVECKCKSPSLIRLRIVFDKRLGQAAFAEIEFVLQTAVDAVADSAACT